MSDDRYDDCTYTGRVIRQSDKGLLVKIRNTEGWLPKSQVGKHPRIGTTGPIVLPRWLALEKGLGMPESQEPQNATPAGDALAEDWRSDADERTVMNVKSRLELFERDLDLLAKMQAKLIRAVGAMALGLQALHDKDPGKVGDAIAELKRAMSSNPMDRPREAKDEEASSGDPF